MFAADGAANLLIAAGKVPDVVVGDLDSASPDSLALVPRVLRMSEQETTDCDKLLMAVANDGHEAVVLTNVEGDRPDHFLATLGSAARSPLIVGFALRRGLGRIVGDGSDFRVDLVAGQLLSLIPLTVCEGVEMAGVRWKPKDLLAPDGARSVSNEASGGEFRVSVRSGSGFLFIEYPGESIPIWASIGL